MTTIERKIKEATKFNGEVVERVYLLDDAHHACNPSSPRQWEAPAIRFIDDNHAEFGFVRWDFDCVENYDEVEDATFFPWDDEEVYEFEKEDEYNLVDNDEMEDFEEKVNEWI